MLSRDHRSMRFVLAFAAFLCLGADRDWKQSPAIVEVDTREDVWAIGDVHGDYERLVDLLTEARVIAERPAKPHEVKWNLGKAVLVCTGDMIDKGDESLHVLALFRALQADADRAGGRVIITMGNHEAEFLADPQDDKKAKEFRAELKAKGLDPVEVAQGRDRDGIGAFLRSLPFAARVNDWFFAHAGNTQGKTLAELNAALRDGVDQSGFGADILSSSKSLLEAKLKDPRPWWEADGDTAQESRARLGGFLDRLGVKHLVIGHQPEDVRFSDGSEREKGKMFAALDGMVFLIDVGMSRAKAMKKPELDYSKGALLLMQSRPTPKATKIRHDGSTEPLWPKQ
jgi:hypothetical protein